MRQQHDVYNFQDQDDHNYDFLLMKLFPPNRASFNLKEGKLYVYHRL